MLGEKLGPRPPLQVRRGWARGTQGGPAASKQVGVTGINFSINPRMFHVLSAIVKHSLIERWRLSKTKHRHWPGRRRADDKRSELGEAARLSCARVLAHPHRRPRLRTHTPHPPEP